MGSTVNGIYVPDVAESGWGASVSNNMRRLADVSFNVKAYGATGDGVTNDQAACQAAVDAAVAAGGGIVYFPRGTYKLTTTLTLSASNSVILEGAGVASTTLKPTAAAITFSSGTCSHNTIRDLTVDGAVGGSSIGVSVTSGVSQVLHTVIENVKFVSCGTAAINMAGDVLGLSVRDVMFLQNVISINHNGTAQVNTVHLDRCWFQSAVLTSYINLPATAGGRLDGWQLTKCLFEGPAVAGETASIILGAMSHMVFTDCHWADFTGGSTRPLIKHYSPGGANSVATQLTFISCDLTNGNGALFDIPDTGTSYWGGDWTFISCKLNTPNNDPFLFVAARGFESLTFIGCSFPRAQVSWEISRVTYLGVFEVSSFIPQRLYNGGKLVELTATGALDMLEQTDPAAPAANRARLYSKDNGAGKTQIVARFPTGAVQVIATEP